ncbi:hypothetical protein TNCV_287871 [Trichonephila clavipes]|nr:hypothetical protein TNCV_287871 [Trichonephila clavipes]
MNMDDTTQTKKLQHKAAGYMTTDRKFRSLDIIGHWNAKRSSVPYLEYWALDVDLPAFEIVHPDWWTWKETVGGGELMISAVSKNSKSRFVQANENSSAIGRQGSVSENSIRCAWCRVCD